MPRTFDGEADPTWLLDEQLRRDEEREPRVYRARRFYGASRRLDALSRSLKVGALGVKDEG